MLFVLIRKQFAEMFQGFLIDRRNGSARNRGAIILRVLLYIVLIAYFAVSIALIAYQVCEPLYEKGVEWMYFSLFILIALALGVFASVFRTYSGLYLSKDNDLILSMPIPVRLIIISRVVGVYLVGLMYSAVVLLPMMIIYFIVAKFTVKVFIGCLLQLLFVSLAVLVLSCALGYVVARISVKLKNKSIITVVISLVLFALYMFTVSYMNNWMNALILNAVAFGEGVKNTFYPVYAIGIACCGDHLSLLIIASIVIALSVLTFFFISRSFLKVITAVKNVSARKKAVKNSRVKSAFGALFGKEVSRFLSSSTYMLNCGLGVIMIPLGGIFMLVMGGGLKAAFIEKVGDPTLLFAIVIVVLCVISSMVDTAAPSVSLEGNTLWQLKCLPIKAGSVLFAKFLLQFVLTAVPVLFSAICSAIAIRTDVFQTILILVVPLVFITLNTMFDLFLGLSMANLKWKNEIVPIKQAGNIPIALFGSWLFMGLLALPYVLLRDMIDVNLYFVPVLAIMLILCFVLYKYLKKYGVKRFNEL